MKNYVNVHAFVVSLKSNRIIVQRSLSSRKKNETTRERKTTNKKHIETKFQAGSVAAKNCSCLTISLGILLS